MFNPRPVLGTSWFVRPISMRAMFDVSKAEGMAQMAGFLAECVVDADGKPVKTAAEWADSPYPLVSKLNTIGLEVNGLTGSPIEDAAGN